LQRQRNKDESRRGRLNRSGMDGLAKTKLGSRKIREERQSLRVIEDDGKPLYTIDSRGVAL
jgi:hypothetical protein